MEIQALIDINELKFDSPFISEVEWRQNDSEPWSCYPHKPICQVDWDQMISKEVDKIADDNPFVSLIEGEISAAQSINHKQGSYGMDTRPKVLNKSSNEWTLLDTGSVVSCLPRQSTDIVT